MAPRKKINFLRWEEAAELLTVSENTVRRLVASGQLPAYNIGGRTRIDEEDIWAYLAEHRTKAAALRRQTRVVRPGNTRTCSYTPGDKVV